MGWNQVWRNQAELGQLGGFHAAIRSSRERLGLAEFLMLGVITIIFACAWFCCIAASGGCQFRTASSHAAGYQRQEFCSET